MKRTPPQPLGKLIARMALFVLLGVPMVAYLWETLNQLLAFEVAPMRLLITVPVLLLFVGLMVLLARRIQRIDKQDHPEHSTPGGNDE